MSDITLTELAADPSAPSANKWRMFFKAAGFFIEDDLGTVIGPIPGGGAGGGAIHAVDDILNTSSVVAAILRHTLSAGVAADGFGVDLSFELENASDVVIEAGRIRTLYRVATSGAEDSSLVFSTRTNGGLVDFLTLDGKDRLVLVQTNDNVGRTGGFFSQFTTANAATIQSALVAFSRRNPGTPTPGFGTQLLFQLENDGGDQHDAGALRCEWVAVTAGTETSRLKLLRYVGGAEKTAVTIDDTGFQVHDDVDATKILNLDASAIATGTTRTLTAPDKSGTLAVVGDVIESLDTSFDLTSHASESWTVPAGKLGTNGDMVEFFGGATSAAGGGGGTVVIKFAGTTLATVAMAISQPAVFHVLITRRTATLALATVSVVNGASSAVIATLSVTWSASNDLVIEAETNYAGALKFIPNAP